MSEFSDSYHLLTSDISEVKQLIQQSGYYGMVIPVSSGNCIPFLVEDNSGGPIDEIIDRNTHQLIHYSFYEDWGCRIKVFQASREIATLTYEKKITIPPNKLEIAINTLLSQELIDQEVATQLETLAANFETYEVGPQVAEIFGLQKVDWLSCQDLTHQSQEELEERFPGAEFINLAEQGKIHQSLPPCQPNQWCSEVGQPAFMYLPVPEIKLTAEHEFMRQRHLRYWTEFRDFDDNTGEGYWMLERYQEVLPRQYQYLPNRLMNLYDPASMAKTIEAIIGLAGSGVDWEPYLRDF
jgi:hypothetical protein